MKTGLNSRSTPDPVLPMWWRCFYLIGLGLIGAACDERSGDPASANQHIRSKGI